MIRALCLCVFASPVLAVNCADRTYNEISYSTCQVNVGEDKVALFLYDDNGQPYGQFMNLVEDLSDKGKEVLFAINAGMFHPDLRPVGHYIENNVEEMRVISKAGPGNFGMLPKLLKERVQPGRWPYSEGLADCLLETFQPPKLTAYSLHYLEDTFYPKSRQRPSQDRGKCLDQMYPLKLNNHCSH